ncbi:hypothetical protein [Cryobacterium roopkundense]|uniref:Uncharacterized protein n=1 Tax=Cryobacterium roopkundense TaxID=1001240 RepID=A0A7W8ZYG0_9MICO|nr:hypothetical protein [Cryobacterium roopkundense]MBB5642543.1 hypothetical protein [Cryobacterium roopkundense]
MAQDAAGAPSRDPREGHKYFDLGRDWQKIKAEQGLTDDDMFAAYIVPFLDDSIQRRQVIRFASDPVGDPGFLGRQFEYLLQHGYIYDPRERAASPSLLKLGSQT